MRSQTTSNSNVFFNLVSKLTTTENSMSGITRRCLGESSGHRSTKGQWGGKHFLVMTSSCYMIGYPTNGIVRLTVFDGPLCVGRWTLRLIRTCNCRWWPLLLWSLLPLLCRVRCLRLAHTSHLRLYNNCARLSNDRLTTCRVDVLNGLTTRGDVLDGATSSNLAVKQHKVNRTSHPYDIGLFTHDLFICLPMIRGVPGGLS